MKIAMLLDHMIKGSRCLAKMGTYVHVMYVHNRSFRLNV